MKAFMRCVKTESILFVRNFFGFFFTFFFPLMMLFLFGSIYGNEPSAFFGGRGSMDVSVPSYIAMVVAVNGLMSFPLALSEYQDRKIYKRFDATPFGKGKVIASQLLVYLVSTMLGVLLLVACGVLAYHIRIEGSALAIVGALLLSTVSLYALGFFLAAIARDAKITNLLCYLLYFLMLFTSGATLPSEMFPESIRLFSKFLPLTHVVDLMKNTFAGAPWSVCWIQILVLSALAVLFGGFGWMVYRRKNLA